MADCVAYARAQLPAERPERLRGLGLCVTFARIQLPVLALRASTHSPGINDLFLIVLGTTTITLPNPDGLNTNRALDLLPGGNTRTLNGSLRAGDREFPRSFH